MHRAPHIPDIVRPSSSRVESGSILCSIIFRTYFWLLYRSRALRITDRSPSFAVASAYACSSSFRGRGHVVWTGRNFMKATNVLVISVSLTSAIAFLNSNLDFPRTARPDSACRRAEDNKIIIHHSATSNHFSEARWCITPCSYFQ